MPSLPAFRFPASEPVSTFELLRLASENLSLPAVARGRAGFLVTAMPDGGLKVLTHFEPLSEDEALAGSFRDVTKEMLFPEAAEEEAERVTLTDGRGQSRTLEAVLEENLFSAFPEKPLGQGFEQIEKRKALWRGAMLRAVRSPAIQLFLEKNKIPGAAALHYAEMQIERPAPYDVKTPGVFYQPDAGLLPLVRFLASPQDTAPSSVPSDPPPEIPVLFEDRHLVLIEKPANLSSVPGTRGLPDAKTLLEEKFGPLRVVHRLDFATSGIMMYAKTAAAEQTLQKMFREGALDKRYTAKLAGTVPEDAGTVRIPLAMDPFARPRQRAVPERFGGKTSVTNYRTVWRKNGETLVQLYPATGRTHQLRIHCAHPEGLGCPIANDPLYGSGLEALRRDGSGSLPKLALHMSEITFPHPADGREMHFLTEPGF